MKILLQDKPIQINENLTYYELAKQFKKDLKPDILGVTVNGELADMDNQIQENQKIDFVNFEDRLGKYLFWHTSAHVLAQAILRHFPDALPTIGPPIENGFYYDFADFNFSEEDFECIEKEAQKILIENLKIEKIFYQNKEEALNVFQNNPYKTELIEEFGTNLTAYSQGEFTDLCRGPHLPYLNLIKSFKILKTSGAYWRADAKNAQLTRVYGIAFPDKKMMQSYLHRLEEAKARDHRVIGSKLSLFSFQTVAPGMVFIHPKGMTIWTEMLKLWHQLHQEAGYQEIKTPSMMDKSLWIESGHWENYKENMYTSEIDDHEYAIKPMNCPGCCLYFRSGSYSYKQLPIRIAEIGHVHRHELSGTLSGLFRVRSFYQDDSHLFMTEEHIENEIIGILELAEKLYAVFGLEYHLELSTKPEKSIGSDEQWEIATQGLKQALDKKGCNYKINEGDGAFYGPKIDLHIKDALERTWQCGTIQLDMNLPERFNLTYIDTTSQKQRPIMLHRTIYGSIERFMGILIEHFKGRFPFWLSPEQVRLLPISDQHIAYAEQLQKTFTENEFRCEVDRTIESVNKKVRRAQLDQVNYILVIGDKEKESHCLNIRSREKQVKEQAKVADFIEYLKIEKTERHLFSQFFDQ